MASKKQPIDKHAAHQHRNKIGGRTRDIGEVRHLPDDPNLVDSAIDENDEHSQPGMVSESTDSDSDSDMYSISDDGKDDSASKGGVSKASVSSSKSFGTAYYEMMMPKRNRPVRTAFPAPPRALPPPPRAAAPSVSTGGMDHGSVVSQASYLTESTAPPPSRSPRRNKGEPGPGVNPAQQWGIAGSVVTELTEGSAAPSPNDGRSSPSKPPFSGLSGLMADGQCDRTIFTWAYDLRPSSNAAQRLAHKPTSPRKSKERIFQGPRQIVADWEAKVGPRPIVDSSSTAPLQYPISYSNKYFTSDGISLDAPGSVAAPPGGSSVDGSIVSIGSVGRSVASEVTWNGTHHVRSFHPLVPTLPREVAIDRSVNTAIIGFPEASSLPGKLGRDTVTVLTARETAATVAAAARPTTSTKFGTAVGNTVRKQGSPTRPEGSSPKPTGKTFFMPSSRRAYSPLRGPSPDQATGSTGTRGHLGSRDFYASPVNDDADAHSRTTRLSWSAKLPSNDPRKSPQPMAYSSIAHVNGDNSQMSFVQSLCLERNSPPPPTASPSPLPFSETSKNGAADDESVTIDEDQLSAFGINDVSILVADRRKQTVLLRRISDSNDGGSFWDVPSGPIDSHGEEPVYTAAAKALEVHAGVPTTSEQILLLLRVDPLYAHAVVEVMISQDQFEAEYDTERHSHLQFFPVGELPENTAAKARVYCEEWVDGLHQIMYEEVSVVSPVLPFTLPAKKFHVDQTAEERRGGALLHGAGAFRDTDWEGGGDFDVDNASVVSAISTLGGTV